MDSLPHACVQEPVSRPLMGLLGQGLGSSGQSPIPGGERPGSAYCMPTNSQSLLLTEGAGMGKVMG